MHAMVRTYSGPGASELIDALAARKADVEAVVRGVPGVVSYSLIKTADGGVSVTVCQDKAGADASLAVSRDWMAKNLSGLTASPPAVTEGVVVVQVK